MRQPLTQLAHAHLRDLLRPGGLAVDATVGNGHDTLFLAAQVSPGGTVAGFDIQPEALASARERLARAGLAACVQLIQHGHEHMREMLPTDWPGRVDAITFNLGYLPGSDRRVVTRAESTVPALRQALELLRPGGLLSVLVYRGHPGGEDEAMAVADWIRTAPPTVAVTTHDSPGPRLYLVQRSN